MVGSCLVRADSFGVFIEPVRGGLGAVEVDGMIYLTIWFIPLVGEPYHMDEPVEHYSIEQCEVSKQRAEHALERLFSDTLYIQVMHGLWDYRVECG